MQFIQDDSQQATTSSGYSSWPKYLACYAVSEIINDSQSEECVEISNTENSSGHFHFSCSSNVVTSKFQEVYVPEKELATLGVND